MWKCKEQQHWTCNQRASYFAFKCNWFHRIPYILTRLAILSHFQWLMLRCHQNAASSTSVTGSGDDQPTVSPNSTLCMDKAIIRVSVGSEYNLEPVSNVRNCFFLSSWMKSNSWQVLGATLLAGGETKIGVWLFFLSWLWFKIYSKPVEVYSGIW